MIDLRFDLVPSAFFERSNVDFVIEVADIAHDGFIFHCGHVGVGNHALVAGGGHENIALVSGVFHGHDLEAFHRGLQRVDRINLGHPHLRGERTQCLRRALAHVAVTCDHGHLAGNHHVGRALDRIDQGFTAAVQVVKLALGD